MRKSKKQSEVVDNSVQNKTWSYAKLDEGTKQNCTLSFSLRVDVKSQMETYVELLERALKDIKADIAK